jgi:hypothetical protein
LFCRLPRGACYLACLGGGWTAAYVTLWEQQQAAAIGPEQTRRFLLDLAAAL